MKKKNLMMLSLISLVALSGCKPKTSEKPSQSETPSVTDPSVSDPSSEEVVVVPELANGVKNFASAPIEDREEILHLMEKYTIDNFLGGIPYRDSSAYVLYNPRLVIPADEYVVGYGYGVGEGTLKWPLTDPGINKDRAMYFHTWNSEDPATINYLDAQDSVTGDMHSMVSSGYWSTRFNADKTGYEWYPLLADDVDRPIPLNMDDKGMATRWRVPVKTGGALVYNTLSEVATVAAFADRPVALEDYLTPFKLMVEEGWFRSTDLGTRASGFVGVAEELKKKPADRDFSRVSGIKLNVDENAIDFEFVTAKTPFYAMYNLSSSLFTPIPADFITAIGGAANYGKPNKDSILSLGVYMVEEWEIDKQLVFKKNPKWIESNRYNHAGYVYTVLDDNVVAFSEFLAGKLDSAGVPSTRLQEFKGDPRARQTKGDTIWKLQVNAADEELWNELFGPNGSVSPKSDWDLKPVMSNHDFLEGVYFSLDRKKIAESTGSRPAQAFLSDAYTVDPEVGTPWRDTEKGKAVVADRLPEDHGFSKELAGLYFNKAMDDLVAAKKYVRGTAAAPTEIGLSVIYQTPTQAINEGGPLEVYIEEAFNDAVEGFKLDIVSYAGNNWMDAYYAAMYGEFDFAFGSISGNTLDPINFMDTVCSDNRSGFTLSWGTDTSLASEDLVFKNEIYSFDTLLESAQGLTLVEDGRSLVATTWNDETWDAEQVGDSDTWKFYAEGTYYVDPTGEYVIEADPVAFLEFIFYDGDYEEIVGRASLNASTFKDGVWEVDGVEFVIPADAVIFEVYLYTVHSYKGTVESKELEIGAYYSPNVWHLLG